LHRTESKDARRGGLLEAVLLFAAAWRLGIEKDEDGTSREKKRGRIRAKGDG